MQAPICINPRQRRRKKVALQILPISERKQMKLFLPIELWGINGHSVGDGGHGVRLRKRQRLKKPK
jgi:hypothetical protein